MLSSRTARFPAAFQDNQAMITDYQAKYFVHCLVREGGEGPERKPNIRLQKYRLTEAGRNWLRQVGLVE